MTKLAKVESSIIESSSKEPKKKKTICNYLSIPVPKKQYAAFSSRRTTFESKVGDVWFTVRLIPDTKGLYIAGHYNFIDSYLWF